jgi:RNA-directed DNA polymerase
MQTRLDVATALGVTHQRLCYILYRRRDRNRYGQFTIAKRNGGLRKISSPPRSIYWLQLRLYQVLKRLFTPKSCVHGFAPSRSIVTNAITHVRRRHLITFDLEDCFPTIHIGRVTGVFTHHPFEFGSEAATVIAQICCRGDGTLPQGGIMSPFISNFVCRTLDNELLSFAKKHRLRYSRYADDLTFSTSQPSLPKAIVDLTGPRPTPGPVFAEIVSRNQFRIHPGKVKYRSRSRRQEVTGLTANQFPNVKRRYVRQIESALYSWSRHGYLAAQSAFEASHRNSPGIELRNVLRGRLAFLKMVRGEDDFIYRRLVRTFNRVSDKKISIPAIADASSCPLHNCVLPWNRWVTKYSSEVLHLLFTNENGDESGGSAFHIGGGTLITAGHNVRDKAGNSRGDLRVKVGEVICPVQVVHCSTSSIPAKCDIGCLRMESPPSCRGIPTQLRLPEIGEEVAAIGFPAIPLRHPTLVLHAGTIEALPATFCRHQRFIKVSFQSGGGLSGGCLIDKSGHVLGVMVENVYLADGSHQLGGEVKLTIPDRPYGQAVPMEYVDEYLQT